MIDTNEFIAKLTNELFCPEMGFMFPSEAIKIIAYGALSRLWLMEDLTLRGVTYFKEEIRKLLLEEMTPRHLENAIKIFTEVYSFTDSPILLAMLIFREIIDFHYIVESCLWSDDNLRDMEYE